MPRLSNVFRASLESQQDSAPTTPVVSDPVIDHAVDLAEQQAKFEKASDQFETLSDVAEALESIAVTMEGMRDTGLTPQAAHFMNLAVDNLSQRAGYSQPATLGLEAFVGQRARVSTTISLEGVTERIKEVWEKIVAALKAAFAQAARYFQSLARGADSLAKKTEKLEDELHTQHGKATQAPTHFAQAPRAAYALSVHGKILSPDQGVTLLHDFLVEMVEHNEVAKRNRHLLEHIVHNAALAHNDEAFTLAIKGLSEIRVQPPKGFDSTSAAGDGDKWVRIWNSKQLPGEVQFEAHLLDSHMADPKDPLDYLIRTIEVFKITKHQTKWDGANFEIRVLSEDEIADLNKKVQKIAGIVKQLETEEMFAKEDLKLGRPMTHEFSQDNKRRFEKLLHAWARYNHVCLQTPLQVGNYVLRTAMAFQSIAEESFVLHYPKAA